MFYHEQSDGCKCIIKFGCLHLHYAQTLAPSSCLNIKPAISGDQGSIRTLIHINLMLCGGLSSKSTLSHKACYQWRSYVGEHEVLPSSTFVELLSFRFPPHQNLHLCKTFNSLNVSMKLIHINYI